MSGGYSMQECYICKEGLEFKPALMGSKEAYTVNCSSCGTYQITRKASINLKRINFSSRQMANIAGWLSENPTFEIT